jgi:hypothetical protein
MTALARFLQEWRERNAAMIERSRKETYVEDIQAARD